MLEFELVVKVGLWLACGMIACVYFVLMEKKDNGEAIITVIHGMVVGMGPISLCFAILNLLSKINIRI